MAAWNFSINQYATFRRTLYYTVDGLPLDLTGHDFKLQMRPSPSSETVYAEWSLGSGMTLEPELGILHIEIDESVTANYNFTIASYDLLHTYFDGYVNPDVEGKVFLHRGVTR